jgi:hypothetical protein
MDARKHGHREEAKRGQKRKSDKRDTHRGTPWLPCVNRVGSRPGFSIVRKCPPDRESPRRVVGRDMRLRRRPRGPSRHREPTGVPTVTNVARLGPLPGLRPVVASASQCLLPPCRTLAKTAASAPFRRPFWPALAGPSRPDRRCRIVSAAVWLLTWVVARICENERSFSHVS